MNAAHDKKPTPGRLKRRSDFLRVQETGRKWVSQSLILQAVENGTDCLNFGLTVSKKASPSAVIRNRIRRRLRAQALALLPVKACAGVDYVLVGRGETANKPFAEIEKDLLWCLKRLDLLKKEEKP